VKRFLSWLKNFFLPLEGAPVWIRVLPYVLLGALTLVLLTGAAYTWDFTNSPQFCGTTCHTMPPQYTAYQTSPHARIDCVDCHIGKGFIATRITRKAGDLKHVFNTMFKNYEFPIVAAELRPARETCEKCHFPEKFSGDALIEIKHYVNDKDNTATSTYLSMKIGGGSARQGLGLGIHWHIENKIEYLPTDTEEQTIPYVRVTRADGSTTEYKDITSELDLKAIDPAQLKEMDCITCHNRVTHLVQQPEDTVDQLIAHGQISTQIPEIRKKAVAAYSQVFDSTQMGLENIAGIEGYYQAYYPDFYNQNTQLVKGAIHALQDAYAASVYPEQKSDWTTHPNNVGHKYSPGCFRCHDGKHLDAKQQAIRLECNLCHSVPVVAGPTDFVAHLEISRGPEPETHKNANWISLHNQAFNSTCQDCHTTADPGGISNASYCSNSACHGNVWKYAGFDAPALRKTLISQLPPQPTPQPLPTGGALTYEATIGPLLKARCGSCHGENGIKGLSMATYQSLMAGGQDGPVVMPGGPSKSSLVQKQSSSQPHFGQLTPEELQLLVQWIQAGAPEK